MQTDQIIIVWSVRLCARQTVHYELMCKNTASGVHVCLWAWPIRFVVVVVIFSWFHAPRVFQLKPNISLLMEWAHLPHFRTLLASNLPPPQFQSLYSSQCLVLSLVGALRIRRRKLFAVKMLNSHCALHFDPRSLSKTISKHRDHTLCLYIYRLSHREQVFDSFHAFKPSMCECFICLCVSRFVFIQA